MRKDFQEFLNDNQSFWSYNIVPDLVDQLDAALKAGTDTAYILASLSLQGITYTGDKLRFTSDIILGNP